MNPDPDKEKPSPVSEISVGLKGEDTSPKVSEWATKPTARTEKDAIDAIRKVAQDFFSLVFVYIFYDCIITVFVRNSTLIQ